MGKLVKCKTCGNEIASSAKICTSCGAKNKKPFFKKWWFWLIVVIFIIAVGSSSGNNSDTSTTPNEQTEVKVEEKNKPTISKSEFDALQTGMTYEEAVAIIGGEGELSSQVEIAGYKTEIYMWKGEGSLGANANATFQNNSLSSKAQFGLE